MKSSQYGRSAHLLKREKPLGDSVRGWMHCVVVRARKCTKFTESVTYGRGEMEAIATAMQVVTQRFY
jgi:hypothetical protein